ncbi:MAG TPA: tRNA (adenosine(37)-N6)-threonylcarbamoyltransferase complex ATPase subunit type 1 TsaE [Chitinispirillaceae bacterium]|nr:tRNA (adenosine(37)-N6)-threonylcarbamoyltransferase complex ATPase subunit type 1 TsaE [Chitinispirillaceae bacterium]
MVLTTNSVSETRQAGARFAETIAAGDVIVLDGGLGCGKTEFVRGIVESLDTSIIVRSPSFSIVNIYQSPVIKLYHFDFYRIEKVAELGEIGFAEYCNSDGACIIEWGLMFPEVLPAHKVVIKFSDPGDGVRRIEVPFEI